MAVVHAPVRESLLGAGRPVTCAPSPTGFFPDCCHYHRDLLSFPTRRSSDLTGITPRRARQLAAVYFWASHEIETMTCMPAPSANAFLALATQRDTARVMRTWEPQP